MYKYLKHLHTHEQNPQITRDLIDYPFFVLLVY